MLPKVTAREGDRAAYDSAMTFEGGPHLRTRFTDLIGCRVPIQLASMGGVATPALAGAVAANGGLGMLAGISLDAAAVTRQAAEASALAGSGGKVGVGFLVPFLDLAAFEAAAAVVPIVECFYGDPDASVVERAHHHGALISWQVGSLAEALAAVEQGCDLVVVQGVEAGGHVRGTEHLIPLVEAARSRLEVPIVAAGGIGTGRQAAEAIRAGADAVRVGTRFLAAAEADVHPDYLAALVAAGADDTELTEAFSAVWPDAPHRVLRSCIAASDDPPEARLPVPPTREFAGDTASSALYAGRSVDAVVGPTTVAAVMSELVAEMGVALAEAV